MAACPVADPHEGHMPVGSLCGGVTATRICTDPQDLNQDGKVTEAEFQAYTRNHPEETPKVLEANRATQTTLNDLTSGASLLDLTV